MSLAKKTFLVLISTVIISTLSIYLASRVTLLQGYEEIEHQDTRANVLRVVNSYFDQSRSLDLVGRAYAFWDDMYYFVAAPDPVFLASLGLTPDLFATHHANLIAILDVRYQTQFLEMYDLNSQTALEIPPDLKTYLQPGSSLLAHTAERPEINGVITLSGRPMYIASLSSLRTDFRGEPRGALLFGRYLDDQVLANLAETSQLDVSAYLMDDASLPEDVQRANAWLAAAMEENAVYVQSLDADTVAGYTYIFTLDHRPGFLLKVAMPRNIYQQGLESFGYFGILAGIGGLGLLIVSLLLLRQVVLSPLTTLTQQVSQIRASGDHSQRVTMHGSDELADLSDTINGMLGAIEKHSQERTRAIFDAVNDAIFIHASDGRILDVNETATRLYGYTRQEFTTLNIGTFSANIPPYTQADAERWLGQSMSGQPQLFEWLLKTKDGRLLWAEINVRFVQLGQEALYLVVVRDITERKKANVEREKFIAELESRNAELERFTYTVSHDLKSPLVTIRGFLGYVEKDALQGDFGRLRRDMERITDATDKMQRLLTELLELSRIGRMVNPPEAIPFEAIVREAMALTFGRCSDNVMIEVALGMPVVWGDRIRLVEVVQNLLDNACKFASGQFPQRIEIGQKDFDSDGKPIFFIRDNGIGIEPQHLERIFGLFEKLNPTTEGTGIGLALVKRIIEIHGGKIWVESQGLGTGSTFYFSLPVYTFDQK